MQFSFGAQVVAHDEMVTWLDVGGVDLVSSGGDGCVAHWDLRKMSNAASGCPPTRRVKVGPEPGMLLKVNAPDSSHNLQYTKQEICLCFNMGWSHCLVSLMQTHECYTIARSIAAQTFWQ